MVEVLVAMTLLLAVLIPSSFLLERGVRATADTRDRVVAIDLATQAIEKVRQEGVNNFASIPQGLSKSFQTVGGINYEIDLSTQFVTPTGGIVGGPCTTGVNGQSQVSAQILSAVASVQWPTNKDVNPITEATTISPPAGYFQANTAQIAVSVTGAAPNSPQSGVTATVFGPASNPKSYTLQTVSDGCAYFVNLPVDSGGTSGTYTVTLSAPGYISNQGATNPSQTYSVSVGNTTNAAFVYDQAATLDFTFGGSPAPATNLPVTAANSHIVPTGWVASSPGATSMTVFPFTDGYQTWAGDCAENDPQAVDSKSVPYYPGGTRDSPVSVSPGGTTSAAVPLYPLSVEATSAGSPVSGATVTITEDGNGCNPNTYGMPTTATTGTTTAGVPLGQFVVTAKSGALQGKTYIWVTPTVIDSEPAGNQADPSGTAIAGAVTVAMS